MSTIVDVVAADTNLTAMLKGVKASGLDNELSKTGPYTVFAPSNLAFGKLPGGEMDDLLKDGNKEKIATLLNGHIVAGKSNFSDLKDGQKLKTLSGRELTVKIADGNTTINGARIQARDHEASNGVVHSLDTLLSAN